MYSFYDYVPQMGMGGRKKGKTFSGNLFYQAGGQPPKQSDYGDNFEAYQAAMDAWEAAQEMPTSSGNYGASFDQVLPAPPAANAPEIFTNKFKLNPYTGVSVADFLATQQKAADYASRKELAKQLGITGYRGTAEQNALLMSMIQQNPDILSSYGAFTGYGKSPKKRGYIPTVSGSYEMPSFMQPNQNNIDPFLYFRDPRQQGVAPASNTPVIDQSGNIVSTAPSTGGGLYGGDIAAVGSAMGVAGVLGGYHLWQEMRNTSFDKTKVLNAVKNRGFRQPQDMAKLIKSGMKPAEAAEALKGYKFQKGYSAEALQKIESEVASHALNKGKDLAKESYQAYKNRFKTAKPILKEVKQTGVRQANTFQSLKDAGLTQKEAQQALKGVKFAPETAKTVGLGTRIAESLEGLLEANKVGQFLKGAFKAFREEGGPVGYYDDGGQWGGTYVPEYGQYAYGGYHSEVPRLFNQPVDRPNKAMYGMGMANGGQMPQWLAQRRFAAAGNTNRLSEYGYAEGGQYNIGDEIEVTPEELEMLKQQGYKFKITG